MGKPNERAAGEQRVAPEPTTQINEAPPAAGTVGPLTRDLLAWVDHRPRSYAEAMEAWRTSCPRFPIWEEALGDGLVCVERSGRTQAEARVVLTPRGRAAIEGS